MDKFDYVIAGGGVAGLSLCYFISQQRDLAHKKILIIDNQNSCPKETIYFSFWADKDFPYFEMNSKSWNKFAVFFRSGQLRIFNLDKYKFGLITNKKFSLFLKGKLVKNKNISFYNGKVDQIKVERSGGLRVSTKYKNFLADFVFDSTYRKTEAEIVLYGKGVIVELDGKRFNPSTVTFYDSRLKSSKDLVFFYLIPLSEKKAIIECTVIHSNAEEKVTQDEMTKLIESYVNKILKSKIQSLEELPSKDIHLSNNIIKRYQSKNHLLIGAAGGGVKSTSGFGFMKIIKDCKNIAESLALTGSPPKFHRSISQITTRLLDKLMTKTIKNSPKKVELLFSELFLNADNGDLILGFLAEENKIGENINLLKKVSPLHFLN